MRVGMASTVLVVMGLVGCASTRPAEAPPVTADKTPVESTKPPRVTPPPNVPLPHAANGTDLAACAGGNCEVLVEGTAEILVSGMTVSVTVNQTNVTFVTATSGMSSSMTPLDHSPVRWQDAATGKSLNARFLGVQDGKAVVKFFTTG